MAALNLAIEIPQFNFDIAQGQDLVIPITYEITGVVDSMDGATLKMELRTQDYKTLLDSLSSSNTRIIITGTNTFNILFPASITTLWTINQPVAKFIYSLEITRSSNTKRLFEGTISVKREQTK